jgi:hypothetical protein
MHIPRELRAKFPPDMSERTVLLCLQRGARCARANHGSVDGSPHDDIMYNCIACSYESYPQGDRKRGKYDMECQSRHWKSEHKSRVRLPIRCKCDLSVTCLHRSCLEVIQVFNKRSGFQWEPSMGNSSGLAT